MEVAMQTTKLSSKGQVIIPKTLRNRYELNTGQELFVIDTGNGILLKTSNLFNNSELEEVAGILRYPGKKISIDQMAEAIEKGALEHK